MNKAKDSSRADALVDHFPPTTKGTMTLPFKQTETIAYSKLLVESFLRWTKRNLIEAPDVARALYHAPFALVSHGTEVDPIFRYANLTAQKLWGLEWDSFIQMPSRMSAEPVVAAERQSLLDEATQKGFVENYQGVRITKDKRRFMIEDTILWNVVDAEGRKHGQACVIKRWHWLHPQQSIPLKNLEQ